MLQLCRRRSRKMEDRENNWSGELLREKSSEYKKWENSRCQAGYSGKRGGSLRAAGNKDPQGTQPP